MGFINEYINIFLIQLGCFASFFSLVHLRYGFCTWYAVVLCGTAFALGTMRYSAVRLLHLVRCGTLRYGFCTWYAAVLCGTLRYGFCTWCGTLRYGFCTWYAVVLCGAAFCTWCGTPRYVFSSCSWVAPCIAPYRSNKFLPNILIKTGNCH